jgi:hypothetical protein
VTECYCGADIVETVLPTDLARLSKKKSLWVHVNGHDSLCYPEDPTSTASATPVDEL